MSFGKCPRCNRPQYPIFDDNKKIIWKNVFHVDWIMMIIVLSILFMSWAYNHDTAACRKMMSDPCSYISNENCEKQMVYRLDETKGISGFGFNTTIG